MGLVIRNIGLSFVLLFVTNSYAQQGLSNIWLQGYGSSYGSPPWGISYTDFYSGTPIYSYLALPMDFNHTHANISDSSGNLLFYTNGVFIADASHDTMMNGSGINPGAYSNFVPDGHLIPQGALIIKKPGWGNEYYLFHNTCDHYPPPLTGCRAYQLYMTIIDMDLNGGLGGVTLKNHPLIVDTLNTGKIHAVKHANGRDWWVVCHRVNSNKFYKLLVTPYGLPPVYSQSIGSYRMWDAGQAKFSPDGTKYAYYHYFNGLDIMDFDRCTGQFSNAISDTTIPWVTGNVGCEFSPNSQFLYVCNILKVYQYDVTVANILSTQIEVAVWDSFAQPGIPGLGAYLCYPQLAPDGKIYITTGNGTTYMGRISNPDFPGLACNVDQHSVLLPTYYFNTIPNHPNYFLGCDTTGSCQCLISDIPELPDIIQVKTYPNPTNGPVAFQFPVQGIAGEMAVYDVNGRLVHTEYVAPWSQFKMVDLSQLGKGIYFCKFLRGDKQGTTKIIVE